MRWQHDGRGQVGKGQMVRRLRGTVEPEVLEAVVVAAKFVVTNAALLHGSGRFVD